MNVSILQATAKHFIPTDKTRPAMQGVYFDCEAKKAVMTNGHILLAVDIEPEPGEKSFIAPLSALPKKRAAEITFDGSTITTIEPGQPALSIESIKEYYPQWSKVMPDMPAERAGISAINFCPALFAGFAAVVKNLGGLDIRLDFLTANSAVKVTPYELAPWEGLIMPVRMKS